MRLYTDSQTKLPLALVLAHPMRLPIRCMAAAAVLTIQPVELNQQCRRLYATQLAQRDAQLRQARQQLAEARAEGAARAVQPEDSCPGRAGSAKQQGQGVQ